MDLISTEILLQIFEYLDTPAPSEAYLHDEPSLDLLTNQPGHLRSPLKAASLVSRSWRSILLPRLFSHVLWKPEVYSLSAFTLNPIPLLRFLAENDLAHRVISFTLVVDFHDPAAIDHQVAPQIRTTDLEWLWDQLFSVIDPLRIDRLFVQLQAKPESGILENGDEMRHIDPNDLWLERDTSYTVLMRELILSNNPRDNWRMLRVFESGDFIDSEAWELVTQIFDRRETEEWEVERPGVFIRNVDNELRSQSGDPSDDMEESINSLDTTAL
ncbi:hypothetical protein NPX13_g6686 [Xylaria arbuscula]|uniref:F-box domain-containing protein n=1 Tax=Xylaria arbuscula TaxID=114810 RepID=A0A9W8NCE4_9PEZI|nr:hypothetical protein NPX13_g6686 [Xylaria arbuscula]